MSPLAALDPHRLDLCADGVMLILAASPALGRLCSEAREGRGKYNWGDKTDGADEAPKEATDGAEAAAEG